MKSEVFSYNDICLIPKHSTLMSRSNANTSVDLCGFKFSVPVVPSNMIDVISFSNAKLLSENGYFYIMHRFENATRRFSDFVKNDPLKIVSISVGVNGESKLDLDYALKTCRIDWVCIDTAHGDHDNMKGMVNHIKSIAPHLKIIAGNVATPDGYKYLCDLGVDVVKVGIGGGQICTTFYETGFHIPTATSVYECAKLGMDVPIIADGGIKHRGDIAKALVLGADMVMCGGLFASCIDSPAKIVGGKKIYRGSTSYAAKGHDTHIEGKTIEIEGELTYEKQLIKIHEALCSSISYAGGKDLSAFNNVEWRLL